MNLQGLLGGIGQALSNPKFRLLWWTNTVNSTGRWQYKFAVSWYTWETTKSPALLGIVAFADTIPLVFMTVIAGAWTDRHGTMLIMRMCQSIMVAARVIQYLQENADGWRTKTSRGGAKQVLRDATSSSGA